MSVESRNPEIILQTIAEYSIIPAYYNMFPIGTTQNIGLKTNANICFFHHPKNMAMDSQGIYTCIYIMSSLLIAYNYNNKSYVTTSIQLGDDFWDFHWNKKALKRKKQIPLPESNSLPLKIGHPHFRKFHRLQSQADFKGFRFQGFSLAIWLQNSFHFKTVQGVLGLLTPRLAQQYLRQADWWNV